MWDSCGWLLVWISRSVFFWNHCQLSGNSLFFMCLCSWDYFVPAYFLITFVEIHMTLGTWLATSIFFHNNRKVKVFLVLLLFSWWNNLRTRSCNKSNCFFNSRYRLLLLLDLFFFYFGFFCFFLLSHLRVFFLNFVLVYCSSHGV